MKEFSGEERPAPARSGVSLVLLLAGIGAIGYGQWQWGRERLAQGLPWMLLGILIAAAGAGLFPARRTPGAPAAQRIKPAEIWFLAALLLAGGAVRFLSLERWPPGGFFDEVQNLLVAEEILRGARPIFIGDATQMPALFFYLLAGAIRLAGRSLATGRGFSALLGTLTLPAFYLLARRNFAWPAAVASTLLLAGSRWHITFSRVGFVGIFGPLLEVLAVLALWKAMETNLRVYYALFGVVVGVGLQSYYSFNLFPAVLLVAVLSYAAREGLKPFLPEVWRIVKGLVWSVLVTGILLVPLATFAIRHPETFFQRSNTVALWNPAHRLSWPDALWENTAVNLLMFQYRGDGNARHNIPGAPILNPIEGVLLAVGIAAAAERITKWPRATWLTWFGVMLLPACLTIEAPQAYRAIGAIPAVYLLMGEGLQAVWRIGAARLRKTAAAVAACLLIAAALAAASWNVSRYFGIQVRNPLAWSEFQADYHEIARFIKPLGGRYRIRVSPVYFDYPILRFHLGPDFPYDRFRLSDDLPLRGGKPQGILYVLEPFQKELFPLFREIYPDARLEEPKDPFGRPMFVAIVVPPGKDVPAPSGPAVAPGGFLGAYYRNENWSGQPGLLRQEPGICFHFHWHADALDHPFSADWAALLRVDEPGRYAFELLCSGPAVLLIGNKTASMGEVDRVVTYRVETDLAPGEHLLLVRYLEKSYASRVCLTWQPPSGPVSIPPMARLRPLDGKEYLRLRPQFPVPGPPSSK